MRPLPTTTVLSIVSVPTASSRQDSKALSQLRRTWLAIIGRGQFPDNAHFEMVPSGRKSSLKERVFAGGRKDFIQ
jgi:hypothetical protein